MNELVEYSLKAFASFFSLINPLGIMPVFMSMTATLSQKQRKAVATKASLTAFGMLILFALVGQLIFNFFSITVDSLRIVGGVIFFMMGYEMLQARLSRIKITAEEEADYVTDISITPLAIPMICGPGAITNAIVFWNDAANLSEMVVLLAVIFVVIFITWIVLVGAGRIMNYMGDTGNKIMLRLMGLIVMVIAVEFFFAGLKPILKGIIGG
ncbi:MAG: MarC family protein [Bacteroidales bacterium]|nr:MarC family protein [Bacteroidales bacterium]MCF8457462.1 MarC family protein [Bacteroidales bacterium]